MAIPSDLVPDPKLFASWQRDPSSSPPLEPSSPPVETDVEVERPSRYVLPQNLGTALQQLPDADLDRLATAVLDERTRRRGPSPVLEDSHRNQSHETNLPSIPQGKVNAVRAAFQAGVTPNRIAREFGLSRSDVNKVLASKNR